MTIDNIRAVVGPAYTTLERPAEENVMKWLASPEYQQIAPLREQGAAIRAVLVEGVTGKEVVRESNNNETLIF